MENHGINSTYNCGGNCTYITQLANTYGLAKSYSALTHPSMANYIALTSGGFYGTSDDVRDGSVNATNIVDSLEANGLTWKAYMESYHGGCSGYGSNYSGDHNPFIKYTDIYNNPARCANIVNAGSDAGNSSSVFLNDLSSDSSPNYMWLTPNLCHDMHECSISIGNTYLANLVPKILDSYIFMTQKAALFITFDEGCCTFPKDYVTTIWAGPTTKQGYKSIALYNHYSLLSTIENFWDLPSLTSNDTTAAPMTEFFTTTTPPGLSLYSSGPITVVHGGSVYNTVTIQSSNSSQARSTRITCLNGLPLGSTCSFNPGSGFSCTSSCSSSLKISTSPSTPAGSYTISVTGNNGAWNSTRFILTVLKPPSQLTGDVNGDCRVNILDLARVAGVFGSTLGPGIDAYADLNLDSRINISDLVLVAANLGNACS